MNEIAISNHESTESTGLASAAGPKELAAQIRNRIRTISKSTSILDRSSLKTLIEDLETQRRLIVTDVASADPDEALGLMWDFMGLAPNVFNRCDDSNGKSRCGNHHSERKIFQTIGSQHIEKPRPCLVTDREYEQCKAHRLGACGHLKIEMPEKKPGKQNTGHRAQGKAAQA